MSFRKGRDFPSSVALSVLAHALLLLSLAMAGIGLRPSSGGYQKFDQATINALQERWSRKRVRAEEPGPFPGNSEERISVSLREALEGLRFDDGISEADRISIAEGLLKSASQMPAEQDWGKKEIVRYVASERWVKDGLDVVDVNGGTEFLVRRMPPDFKAAIDRFGGDNSHAALSIEGGRGVLVPSGEGPKQVPAEYFFRESPFREIAAVGADLFPALHELEVSRQPVSNSTGLAHEGDDGATNRSQSVPDSGIVLITVLPASMESGPDKKPALTIGAPEIEKVLNRLMALDLERQLEEFERGYLQRYDWESSGLALLTREFVFENLNGIFFVLDDLAITYDRLEELFYKRPAYEALNRWAGRFPGTLTDSEISFYIISELDYELRAFRGLLAEGDTIAAVLAGKQKVPTMYQNRAKAAALGRIRSDLLLRLKRLRMSPDRLVDFYLQREQDILSRLAEKGGEIRNRALVNWGELFWRERDYEAAVAKWNMVDLSAPGYSRSFGRVMNIVSRYGARGRARQDIEDRLYSEDALGRADRLERQLRFHVWARRSARYETLSPAQRP